MENPTTKQRQIVGRLLKEQRTAHPRFYTSIYAVKHCAMREWLRLKLLTVHLIHVFLLLPDFAEVK